MILTGLKIDMQDLEEVLDREFMGRSRHQGHPRLRPIAEFDIIETGKKYPDCECETTPSRDSGGILFPGMTLDALLRLGAGCCDSRVNPNKGWVCPRLDSLRRRYGH